MWKIFLAGALLPLAFSPLNYYPLVFIGLSVLLIELLKTKRPFILGWLFGLGFFGVGISWVFVSIHEYGNTNIPLAAFITILFVSFLSLFPALQCSLIKRFYKNREKTCLLIALPSSWVLMEYLRGLIFTGFPWLYLGYSQLNTPLAGFAPIIGVYGVSFLVTFSTSLLILAFKNKNIRMKISYLFLLISIWGTGSYLKTIQWTNKSTVENQVSIIQSNLKPNDKFLLQDPITTIIKLYLKPTLEHLDSNFIIWPENSIPIPLHLINSFINEIDNIIRNHNVSLLVGVPIESAKEPNKYYNSLIALGTAKGTYNKTLLVPFGEYLPFDKWLRGLINFFDIPMSNFVPDNKKQKPLSTPKTKLLPLICYEIAYPQLVRTKLLEQNSNAIITISEDGWFGDSWGPYQHLDIARMRALENGRYVLRSTTSGISAIINEKGKILQKSPQFKEFVLTGKFINFEGFTPWTKYGEVPIMVFCFLGLVLFRKSTS